MKILISAALFATSILGLPQAYAQAVSAPQMKLGLTIDGKKNPEKISRTEAYRHFALHFANHKKPTGTEPDHRLAFKATLGLSASDFAILEGAFVGLREKLDTFGTDQNLINVALDVVMAGLKLSAEGVDILDAYIEENLKPRMQVYEMAPMAPMTTTDYGSPTCSSCLFNFVQSYDVYLDFPEIHIMNEVVVTDNSNCNHSQYETTATLAGPGYPNASFTNPGLSSTVSLTINQSTNSAQTLSVGSTGSFYCPCLGSLAGWGGFGISVTVRITATYVTQLYRANSLVCSYRTTYCLPQFPPTCSGGGLKADEECPLYGLAAYAYLIVNNSAKGTCFPGVVFEADPEFPGGSSAEGPGRCF